MGKQHSSDRQGDSDYASDGKFRQRNLIHRQKHSKPEENELIFFEMRMKVREGVASQFNAKSQRCRSRNGTINPAPLPLRAFALNSGFLIQASLFPTTRTGGFSRRGQLSMLAKFMLMQHKIVLVLAALGVSGNLAVGQSGSVPAGDSEAERAIQGFQIPKGFKCELIAGDDLLANPVAFTIDEQGRFYVAETFRIHRGVPDIRGHMNMLDEELASRSVAERLGYTLRYGSGGISSWTNKEDRISLLWDSDGDGRLDKTKIFSGGYNGMAEGLGSGVLARGGDIYYTDIPNLWLLRDTNGDGVADFKKSLSYGYGVRFGFLGHDLHGLIIGPDGRLYFSIGDRGAHIQLPNGKELDNSEYGAVYRCELDGSNLEIIYTGLRNPQELAFDDSGNLWTVDNNSDAGDPARVVYLAEGGDSGWRVGWQFIERPISRSSWLGERLCYEDFPDRAAYALPPVSSKVGNGPSGFAIDPGVGLPAQWRGKFFLANFSGHRDSGIYGFSVRPQGAGFELEKNEKFWWKFLPTDIEFGYDGSVYVSDWINGWDGVGKGRIYRIYEPDERSKPAVAESKKLFGEGFEQRPNSELVKLLAHADRRVRQEAQFALVAHNASRELARVAESGPTLPARLHAIWGLGQLERKGKHSDFKKLLADPEPEVRSQAAKVLGDARDDRFEKQLIQMLSDHEARPRYFAALTLGKIGAKKSVSAVAAMLRDVVDDPWLRHAGVMALVGCASENEIAALARDNSVTVRLAAAVALRRLSSPRLQDFLSDKDSRVVAEAARAINDLPVPSALPALAELTDKDHRFATAPEGSREHPSPRDAILRRVVNANFRVGTDDNAVRIAYLAANESMPEDIRAEAITTFTSWQKPDGKDHISGLWRPLRERAAVDFAKLEPALKRLLTGSAPPELKAKLLATASKANWRALDKVVADVWASAPATVQAAGLQFLGQVGSPRLGQVLAKAGESKDENVRIAAVKFATKSLNGKELTIVLNKILSSGTVREQQNAFQILSGTKDPEADQLLARQLDELLAGNTPGELQLDLLDAAARCSDEQVKQKLSQFDSRRAGPTKLTQYTECLNGGDAERGRRIFREKVEASCMRCHKINGEGGEAAPDLTKIGSRADRNYILESITFPNAKIAVGFENMQVVLTNGLSSVGIVKRETADELDLLTPDDGLVKIKKSEIKSRAQTLSGMLDNLRDVLTKREIRDLVEYLATLK